PEISQGAFEDPRSELIIADGLKYVAETDERFDAVIVDSTEPIGPAAVLFTPEFFGNCKRCLNEEGVLVTQNGLPFLMADHLKGTIRIFNSLFPDVATYLCDQPTYFGGPFALAWAATRPSLRNLTREELALRYAASGITTRYYTPDVHLASFVLPVYVGKLM